MIFKKKNGHLAYRVGQALPILFLLSCSHGEFPDHHHEFGSFTEVQTMMAIPMDQHKVALERGARIDQVPTQQLVIKPWKSSLLELEHSVWMVRNTKLEPPTYRWIAVDERGRTFWLNNPYDFEELLQFIHAEGLVERFAHTPERLIEVFLDLHGFNEKLLHSLDDIETEGGSGWREENDPERIASLRDQFYPPEAIPGHPLKLDFWTWTRRGGVVARWHLEVGNNGSGDVIYDKVMDRIGQHFFLR